LNPDRSIDAILREEAGTPLAEAIAATMAATTDPSTPFGDGDATAVEATAEATAGPALGARTNISLKMPIMTTSESRHRNTVLMPATTMVHICAAVSVATTVSMRTLPYTGVLPCFLAGRLSRLPRSMVNAEANLARVAEGSMTSST